MAKRTSKASAEVLAPGSHALVTGGSSGIGKATARQLLERGMNVTLLARDPAKLDAARAELAMASQPEQRIEIVSVDVSDRPQLEVAIAGAIATLGTPSLLVTSAGIAHPGYFSDLPIDIFERTMAVNYFGTLYAIRAVLPAMLAAGRGHLALVSSGAGLLGLYGYTPYSPSKFALRGLAEALRGELKPSGIGISIVYPPDTDTPQLAEENKTKPAETKAITATADTWSADGVATTIVDGIAQNRFAITPGTEMRVLNRFHSVLAPALNRYFDQLVAKVKREQASNADKPPASAQNMSPDA
ncbi:MAG: SDR family oxidoreductase [Cyanobacteria bacterium J06638_20]